MDSTNKKTICAYYNLLEETLQKNNLSHSPAQIYDMDETGMPIDPRPPNVVQNVVKRNFVTEIRKKGVNNGTWMCECYWASYSTNGNI